MKTTITTLLGAGLSLLASFGSTHNGAAQTAQDAAPVLTLFRNTDQTLSLSWSGAGVLEQTESMIAPNW